MLMLCCEVLKEPAEIVVTTLPHHLHFYCIYSLKARIITKEKLLLSVKVLKLLKIHFREKIQYGYRLLVSLCSGWHSKGKISYHKSKSAPPFKNNQGGGRSKQIGEVEATLLPVKNLP